MISGDRALNSHRGIRADGAPVLLPAWVKIGAAFLIVIGLASRLSPLVDLDARLFWQYMTEDGYLMQTVARNMAIGLGMSTAEGTLPTNGVQPLATLFFAALHYLAGGDKTLGIVGVTLLSVGFAALSAWLLAQVGFQVFAPYRDAKALAVLAAGLWFVAPLITRHSMNGLETGLYHASILLVLSYYFRHFASDANPTGSHRLILGVLLGICFLARNDAVFFIAALLVAHVFLTVPGSVRTNWRSRMVDAWIAGTVSIVVASPWLIHNQIKFGSIIPISGTAQSHAAELGRNLPWVPSHLFENMVLWAPIPSSLETLPAVQAICAVLLIAVPIAYWWLSGRHTLVGRRFWVTGVLFAAALAAYYGLFFGANWFLPRYTSAASPFLWLFVVGLFYQVTTMILRERRLQIAACTATVILLTAAGLLSGANDFRKGTQHMHKQVAQWVNQHVDAQTWVGAPQTGTLGYFHDRTINLDGKVNPVALHRLRTDGHSLDYVMESPIEYLVDWVGMAEWVTFTHLSQRFPLTFEVIVKDPQNNLAVLKRIAPVK